MKIFFLNGSLRLQSETALERSIVQQVCGFSTHIPDEGEGTIVLTLVEETSTEDSSTEESSSVEEDSSVESSDFLVDSGRVVRRVVRRRPKKVD